MRVFFFFFVLLRVIVDFGQVAAWLKVAGS